RCLDAASRLVGFRPMLPCFGGLCRARAWLSSNQMAKTWVLDTDTKGTGARMVPLDDVLKKPEQDAPKPKPARKHVATAAPPAAKPATPIKPKRPVEKRSTPLPPGHVRKKSNGEIGKVKAIDAKAGTATITWLRDGRTSTVQLSSVTRR